MLFPLSSVPRVFPFPLLSSHLLSRRVWRQQSEKLRRDTDWLRLQPLSCHLSPLLYSHPSSLASRSPREFAGRAWMLEKIFPRASHSSEGESRAALWIFAPFFQDARPSLPTLSLSDLDVLRAYGLWPWNFPSSPSHMCDPFRLFFQYLSTVSRFSNSYAILHKCIQLILILMCFVTPCLFGRFSRAIERFWMLTISGQQQYLFVVRLCFSVARHSPREIPRLENYTPARRTSDYPWPVVERNWN